MIYSKIPLAQTIIELCKSKNIQHIIISPGSRNAPLTIGFTEDPFFKTYSIVDERCAAFFALGIAQQIKMPVVVVCTSGSALLNYYPAVSEAFYSDIPLVVISADRPAYAIDIGDGQTIRQNNIFDKHILYSANLNQDIRPDEVKLLGDGKNQPNNLKELSPYSLQSEIQKSNEKEINTALNIAIEGNGPTHINAPFEEPLYEIANSLSVKVNNVEPTIVFNKITIESLKPYADIWNTSSRKMMLVGTNSPDAIESKIINEFFQDESVIVFTETTSNLHHDNFFPSIDKIIAPIEKAENKDELFKKLQPDILLTFGGMIISKKIKVFLRKYKPKHHWHIDIKKAYDTFFCIEKHFKVCPNHFLNTFNTLIKNKESNYHQFWYSIKKQRDVIHSKYLSNIQFSDLKVFEQVLESIPNNYQLQLSNSSTIRYVQLFDINSTLKVFCNRGTSGIDGSTSTAVGASVVNNNPTLFITGDLSFFYDSNALWNNYIKNDFRIVVVNNKGGGIFRILPGNKQSENFEKYFETSHNLNASHICEMYKIEYLTASSKDDLKNTLHSFYNKSSSPKLLEIFTPRKINDKVLVDYFTFLNENS